MPIYITTVASTTVGHPPVNCLIKAPNAAQAIRHAARERIVARAASAEEVAELMTQGAKLILAAAEGPTTGDLFPALEAPTAS